MKTNYYEIEKNIEKLNRNEPTGFLTHNIYKEIIKKLPKNSYNIYTPYEESDKIILYTNKLPNIKLYKIISYHPLTHQSILGSLFALNITPETFGDIILYEDNFYIYLTETISHLVENNLTQIGNQKVKLENIPLSTLSNYKKAYKKTEIIVSSLRIDNILSKLLETNRNKTKEIITNKLVTLNYETLTKSDYILKPNDIFSIRKHGKYKYIDIIKTTKKNNYIILLKKYI